MPSRQKLGRILGNEKKYSKSFSSKRCSSKIELICKLQNLADTNTYNAHLITYP